MGGDWVGYGWSYKAVKCLLQRESGVGRGEHRTSNIEHPTLNIEVEEIEEAASSLES
jgi:hypothetical protein